MRRFWLSAGHARIRVNFWTPQRLRSLGFEAVDGSDIVVRTRNIFEIAFLTWDRIHALHPHPHFRSRSRGIWIFRRSEFGVAPSVLRLSEKKGQAIVGEHASNVCGLRIMHASRGSCTCQSQMTYLPMTDIPTHGDLECNYCRLAHALPTPVTSARDTSMQSCRARALGVQVNVYMTTI